MVVDIMVSTSSAIMNSGVLVCLTVVYTWDVLFHRVMRMFLCRDIQAQTDIRAHELHAPEPPPLFSTGYC